MDGTERVYDTELKFKRRSNSLTAQSKAILSALADYLEVKPSIMLVMLEGHADDEKNNRKNHDLSEARASVVRDYLIGRGMSPQRAIAFGFGQAHRTSKKRGLNRRVVIRLVSGQMRKPVAATRWEQLGVTHLRGVAIVPLFSV